jgi:hypothetical protein
MAKTSAKQDLEALSRFLLLEQEESAEYQTLAKFPDITHSWAISGNFA